MSPDGSIKPEIGDFPKRSLPPAMSESFNVTDASVAYNGQTVVVMLDYTIRAREGDAITRTNIPVVLVREDEIWKFTYASLVDVLINVGYRHG